MSGGYGLSQSSSRLESPRLSGVSRFGSSALRSSSEGAESNRYLCRASNSHWQTLKAAGSHEFRDMSP